MRLSLTTLLLTCLTLTTQTASADGLLYQLPNDGEFVLYDLDIETKRGDENVAGKGTLKLSSVGSVTEAGKKCRWIEINMTMNLDGMERVIVAKILVPEKHLKAGENPFGNKIRGWVRMSADGEAQELDDNNTGPLRAFLCGPLTDAKKLKPVSVDSKLGKLECAGVSGHTDYEERGRKSRVTFETRRHKKAPFGVVSTKLTIEVDRNGQSVDQAKMAFKLKEVGKDAKSELPDSK